MNTPSSTPLMDRLTVIRAKKQRPPRFTILSPGTMSPFVKAAREKRLTPKTFCGGSYLPDGRHAA